MTYPHGSPLDAILKIIDSITRNPAQNTETAHQMAMVGVVPAGKLIDHFTIAGIAFKVTGTTTEQVFIARLKHAGLPPDMFSAAFKDHPPQYFLTIEAENYRRYEFWGHEAA